MADKLNVLFVGDIVGEPGMNAVRNHLPKLIQNYSAEFVIANGENVTNGKGITEPEAKELYSLGVNVITTGNHIWDNWQSKPLMSKDDRVIRPYNYPPGNAGRGYKISSLPNGVEIAVVQVQGRTFMYQIDCPFRAMDYILNQIPERVKIIIVDFHAEATAEKIAMAWHLDGRVSALIGSHTHIQTADASLLPSGTAYISDVGMTGPYNSVLGLDKEVALKRFLLQTAHKFKMGEGDERLSAISLVFDSETGQAVSIEPIIVPKFEKSIYEIV